MASEDFNQMPTGKNLIVVVANVDGVLHFRMFDGNGKMAIDTDEKTIHGDRTRQIEESSRGSSPACGRRMSLLQARKRWSAFRVSQRPSGHTIPVPGVRAGKAFIHRNSAAMPRVRLAGRPVYAGDQAEAIAQIDRLTIIDQLRDSLIVEDPTRPLPEDAAGIGLGDASRKRFQSDWLWKRTRRIRHILWFPTHLTRDGRPRLTASPRRSIRLTARFGRFTFPGEAHRRLSSIARRASPWGSRSRLCGMLMGLVLWFWPRWKPPLAGDHVVVRWANALQGLVSRGSGHDRAAVDSRN